MYVCGPTVYGPPHLGHGRFSLVFDVLRRYLAWTGLDVTYVSNITDIDDKIIQRGRTRTATGARSPSAARPSGTGRWTPSNVRRPDHDPHATAYVEQMVALIGRLVERGAAYETSDGVYFLSETVDDYGLLARQPLDSLKAGARVEGIDEKRSPVDFALWKKAKPGEPSWPSPWGDGPARLAHRVRGHVARPAGRRLRPARRRPGPGVPPPRERAGPGAGRRAALRPHVGAQRVRRGRGRPRCPSRSATCPT